MLNPASNGICDLSANPTTTLQITSAPCADPRTMGMRSHWIAIGNIPLRRGSTAHGQISSI